MARKKAQDVRSNPLPPADHQVVDQANLFPSDGVTPATSFEPVPVNFDFGDATGGEGDTPAPVPKPIPKPPEPVMPPPKPPEPVMPPPIPPAGVPPIHGRIQNVTGTIPPADDDDFFSPENLRMAQEFAPPADSATFAIDVRKPPKDQYIRVHPNPDFSMVWPIVELEEIVYVIHPGLAKRLQVDPTISSSVKTARIVLCSIFRGPFFVWVVKQPADPTRKSAMHVAMDQAMGAAMAGWCRITWSEEKRVHECFPFRGQNPPEPVWPEKTLPEILKIAFGDARMIKSEDHQVIRKLAGLEL